MRSHLLAALLTLSGCAAPLGEILPVEEHEDLAVLVADEYAPDRVLVGMAPGFHPLPVFRGNTIEPRRIWDDLGVMEVEVPEDADALEVVAELRADPSYTFVEPDLVRYASAVSDPYYKYQWNMSQIGVETAWLDTDGDGAVVAVVDTGVATSGSDRPTMASGGYDFVDNDADPTDLNGHGTHVAGTIAQATNNAKGVVGVAPGASILAVRVLDASGTGYTSDIVDGVKYAADQGADVLNMSYGSSWSSSSESSAVSYAVGKGCIMVAAAGNSGTGNGADYPARYSNVLAVGATRYDKTRTSYSNYGTGLDLMAPGGDTSKDQNGDGYGDGILQETFSGTTWNWFFYQGTSMASPHVAGVAALLVSLGATRAEAEAAILGSATDLSTAGYDTGYGYGLLSASGAVDAFLGGTTPADTTAPVISSVTYSYKSSTKYLSVAFKTDESATGKVCDDKNVCKTTALGTSHSVRYKVSGTKVTISATDAAGNTSSVGPYTFR